jgi:predicted metal-dependent hydrolase
VGPSPDPVQSTLGWKKPGQPDFFHPLLFSLCDNLGMPISDLDIEYRLSPRRRSIGLVVTPQGRVVVTMPPGASRENLAQALAKHRAWIERRVAERKAAWDRLKPGMAYFLGQPFRLTPLRGARGVVSLSENEIRVPLAPDEALWPALKAWYQEQALRFIETRVNHFGAPRGVKKGAVELKGWKRRWGECHPDGKLRFNWRLIMCPPKVIDYVVVHELAHLVVPGHNRRFWSVVAKVLPDYAARRQWLNREGSPLLLWQPEPGPER